MSVRAFRTAAILVAIFLFWDLTMGAQAPQPVSQSPGDAAALAPTTVVVYSQPPRPEGGLLQSSLRDPDDVTTDQWVWDGFTLDSSHAITEVQWRGGYDPARLGSGGPVFDFTVEIYPSRPSGTEPNLTDPPLVHYHVGGNAGEAAAEILGGVQTYDYHYALPAPSRPLPRPSTGSRSKPSRAALPTGDSRKPAEGTGGISAEFSAGAGTSTSSSPAMQPLRCWHQRSRTTGFTCPTYRVPWG